MTINHQFLGAPKIKLTALFFSIPKVCQSASQIVSIRLAGKPRNCWVHHQAVARTCWLLIVWVEKHDFLRWNCRQLIFLTFSHLGIEPQAVWWQSRHLKMDSWLDHPTAQIFGKLFGMDHVILVLYMPMIFDKALGPGLKMHVDFLALYLSPLVAYSYLLFSHHNDVYKPFELLTFGTFFSRWSGASHRGPRWRPSRPGRRKWRVGRNGWGRLSAKVDATVAAWEMYKGCVVVVVVGPGV